MKKIILLFALVILISGCSWRDIPVEKPAEQAPERYFIICNNEGEFCGGITGTQCCSGLTCQLEGTYPDAGGKCVKEVVKIEEKKETPEQITDSLLNVPRVNTAAHITLMKEGKIVEEEDIPAMCYLGAFAMLILFDNSNLDFTDVIAYSGLGSNAEYDSANGLTAGYFEKSIIFAAKNLGYEYALGVKADGKANTFLADFKASASETEYFENEEEAFDYLKGIIDSKKPVEVHLDVYYVIDDFRKASMMWITGWEKGHWSHFMTVTGYDEDYVYLNDPTDPDLNIKNMKASVENFLLAWKNSYKVQGGAQLGPYWMVHIKGENEKAKKSLKEIILWNREISLNSAENIRKSTFSSSIGELTVGRKEFSKFLKKIGYEEAAKLYQEAAGIYATDPENPLLFIDAAQKEEQARGLLK